MADVIRARVYARRLLHALDGAAQAADPIERAAYIHAAWVDLSTIRAQMDARDFMSEPVWADADPPDVCPECGQSFCGCDAEEHPAGEAAQ